MLRIKKKLERIPLYAEVKMKGSRNEFQDYECVKTGAFIPPGVVVGYEVNGRIKFNEGVRFAHKERTVG